MQLCAVAFFTQRQKMPANAMIAKLHYLKRRVVGATAGRKPSNSAFRLPPAPLSLSKSRESSGQSAPMYRLSDQALDSDFEATLRKAGFQSFQNQVYESYT